MFCVKFKETKSIDLLKGIKEYISKHYEYGNFEKVYSFIGLIGNTRSVVANSCAIVEGPQALESLKPALSSTVQYLNMLNLLKSKFNFGTDQFSLKMEFSWKDTIKGDFFHSNNINFEFYSVLFNLGTIYSFMGRSINIEDPDLDENRLKEAIKQLQYAGWVFDKIKQELPNFISSKEVSPDLSVDNLNFLMNFNLGFAQMFILELAARKNLDKNLQAQLGRGVYDLLTSAHSLIKDKPKLYREELILYINNRRYFYYALSYFKKKQVLEEDFKRTASGYGTQITILGVCLDALSSGEMNIKKIDKYINVASYLNFKDTLKKMGEEMYEKNQRIYFDKVPDMATIEKIEKVIKGVPLKIPDDLEKPVDGSEALNDLVPREVRSLMNDYKKQMLDYITGCLNGNINEEYILMFLSELGLPGSLDSITHNNCISDGLWNRIQDFQNKGGSNYIVNQIALVDKTSSEIEKKIQEGERLLQEEEGEDNRLRQTYPGQWNRQESRQLNQEYYDSLGNYKNKLYTAKGCDDNIKQLIMNNMKNFELLNCGIDLLNNKIPVKNDNSGLKNTNEAKDLQAELETLEKLKCQLVELTGRIYKTLDEENIIPQLMLVKAKKITDKQVFAENKKNYETLLGEIEKLSKQINESMTNIRLKFEIFRKVAAVSAKPNEQNEQFLKGLEDSLFLYNQKLVNLTQGLNFYNEFSVRFQELFENISTFILARNMEKEDLIGEIKAGRVPVKTSVVTNQSNQGNKNQGFMDMPSLTDINSMNNYGMYGSNQQGSNRGNQMPLNQKDIGADFSLFSSSGTNSAQQQSNLFGNNYGGSNLSQGQGYNQSQGQGYNQSQAQNNYNQSQAQGYNNSNFQSQGFGFGANVSNASNMNNMGNTSNTNYMYGYNPNSYQAQAQSNNFQPNNLNDAHQSNLPYDPNLYDPCFYDFTQKKQKK